MLLCWYTVKILISFDQIITNLLMLRIISQIIEFNAVERRKFMYYYNSNNSCNMIYNLRDCIRIIFDKIWLQFVLINAKRLCNEISWNLEDTCELSWELLWRIDVEFFKNSCFFWHFTITKIHWILILSFHKIFSL